jgi:serine/threonine protein phosphatase PrpC
MVVGIYKNINRRTYMEDEFYIKVDNELKFYSVFDGHGGASVSKFLSENIYENIKLNSIIAEILKKRCMIRL